MTRRDKHDDDDDDDTRRVVDLDLLHFLPRHRWIGLGAGVVNKVLLSSNLRLIKRERN